MINDGYGDGDHDVVQYEAEVLTRYERWLHKIANGLRPWYDDDHDDIVQEGWIAMWRALDDFDSTKGALASWITTAAKIRMRDFAWRNRPAFGHEPLRGSVEVVADTSVEALLDAGLEEALGTSEAMEGVEMAYHDGQIAEALAVLSPPQREYIFLRFWAGMDPASRVPGTVELRSDYSVMREKIWRDELRSALAANLSHLEGVVC